jgi:hypothetical protein
MFYILWLAAIFGGVSLDLVDLPNLFLYIFFGKFTLGLSLGAFPLPCGSQPLGHINYYTIIFPC